MKGETGGIGKLLLLGLGVDTVDVPQALDDETALLGKVVHHIHKHPPAVQDAVTENRFELLGTVAREAVAHLERLVQAGGSAPQELVEILAGVFVAGEEERHRVGTDLGHNAGGEDAGPVLALGRRGSLGQLPAQALHPHGGVIVMEQSALRPDADQGVIDPCRRRRGALDEFPLGGGGQGDSKMRLPLVHPIHGLACAIAHDRQHGADAGIILAGPGLGRSGSREEGAAQGAAQALQFVDGRLEEWLRHDANQAGGGFEQVEFGPQTLGAELADLECEVGYLDLQSPRVILGPIAAMTFTLGFGLAGGFLGSRIGLRLGRKNLGGRLG